LKVSASPHTQGDGDAVEEADGEALGEAEGEVLGDAVGPVVSRCVVSMVVAGAVWTGGSTESVGVS
jgi:hypothetical protein